MSSNNKIRIYQYGDFVFPSTDINQVVSTGIKTQLEDTPFANGKVKLNKMNVDYRDDTNIVINFSLPEGENRHQIEALCYSEPKKVFFVEEFVSQPFIGKNSTVDKQDVDYKVYFGYGHIVKPSDLVFFGCEKGQDNYQMTIRLMNNKYLIQDTRLGFIKLSDEVKINQTLWGAGTFANWGSGTTQNWGSKYGQIVPTSFNQITQQQRQALMTCCDKSKGFFVYQDLFFSQEVTRIDTSSPTTLSRTVSTGEGSILPLIFSSSPINLVSTLPNDTLIFELENDGTNPALLTGQWIQFLNNDTQSGFKLTCLNSNVPPALSIFAKKTIKLYNSITNDSLDYFNPKSIFFQGFKIEYIGKKNTLFELSNFLPFYELLNPRKNDTIIMTRNFTTGLTIKIQSLPKYV